MPVVFLKWYEHLAGLEGPDWFVKLHALARTPDRELHGLADRLARDQVLQRKGTVVRVRKASVGINGMPVDIQDNVSLEQAVSAGTQVVHIGDIGPIPQ